MLKLSLQGKLSSLVQRRLQVERRGSRRVTPARQTLCMLHEAGEDERTTAIVHNLSSKGAAVLTERAYPIGALLHVLLVNAEHTFAVERDMKVTRCFRATNQYMLAGPFGDSLAHDELAPFVL